MTIIRKCFNAHVKDCGNPVHFTEVNKGAGGTVYRIVEGLKEYFDMDAVAEVVGDKPNALSSFGHMQDFFFKSFTKQTDCTNYIIKLK